MSVDVGQISRQLLVVGVLEGVDPLLLAQVEEIAMQLVVFREALPIEKAARPLIQIKLLLFMRLPVNITLMALFNLCRSLIQIQSIRSVIAKVVEPLPPPPLPPIVLFFLEAVIPDVVLDLQVEHHLLCFEIVILHARNQEVVHLAVTSHQIVSSLIASNIDRPLIGDQRVLHDLTHLAIALPALVLHCSVERCAVARIPQEQLADRLATSLRSSICRLETADRRQFPFKLIACLLEHFVREEVVGLAVLVYQ